MKVLIHRHIILLMIMSLAGILLISTQIGAVNISLQHLYDKHSPLFFLFWQVRLPRLIGAILIGGALSLSGAVMQALFRNPLVEPGIIGVSSGSALFATLAIVLGNWLPFSGLINPALLIAVCACFGGLLVTYILYAVSRRHHYLNISNMLLLGIAINAFAGAFIGILTYLADDNQLRTLTFWSMGSLGNIGWWHIAVLCLLQVLALPWILRYASQMNIMLLGETAAQHLGIPVEIIKKLQIWLVALLVGSAVAFSGGIGFIGLVIPHLIRLGLDSDHRYLLPCSYLAGGALLMIADNLSRTLAAPAEIPVGIFTALMGAPFLTYLVLKTNRRL